MELLFWLMLLCFTSAVSFVLGCMVGSWWSKQEEMGDEE